MGKKSLIYAAIVLAAAVAFYAGSALADNAVDIDIENSNSATGGSATASATGGSATASIGKITNGGNTSSGSGTTTVGSVSTSATGGSSSASATGGSARSNTEVDVEVDSDDDDDDNDRDHDRDRKSDRDKSGKKYASASTRRLPASGSNEIVLFGLVLAAVAASFVGMKKYWVKQ
ncbi:MAG: hypothetical protein Q8L10_02185 [Candidatus Moranbacteria bacterium]|nr:hypothetical protein [Candidatus Moranbacteria bacterium]